MFVRFVFIIGFCFLYTGCAVLSSEAPTRALKTNERLYVGRVLVELNGAKAEKCEIYINSDLVPYLKLASDGWIIYKTDRPEARLSKIACYHRSSPQVAAWHHQELPLANFKSAAEESTIVNFGEVVIRWKIDESGLEEAILRAKNSGTGQEAFIKSSGRLVVETKSNLQEAQNYYLSLAEKNATQSYQWVDHLVEVK